MAIKIKKKYRVISAMNPKTQAKDLFRPVVTERETYYSDNVVEYALKNGYVRGQYHDMLGALNGFIQAVQELGKEGKDVNLSNWLRVHGELTGTVDPENPVLTEKNTFRVNITALKELKRKVSDFSWSRVGTIDEDDAGFTLTGVTSSRTGTENTLNVMTDEITVSGTGFTSDTRFDIELIGGGGARLTTLDWTDGNTFTVVDDKTAKITITGNGTSEPDGSWTNGANKIFLVARNGEEEVSLPLQVYNR